MPTHVIKTEMIRVINWCYKSTGIWTLGITICLFALTFLLITPAYDQPDDPTMALVASGYGNVDGPDEHLIYSNVLIGLILKQLYLTAPLVPWYGGYLLLIQFLAHWILLYALLLSLRDYRCVLGYLLFYLVVGVYLLTHIQFTTTAFLIGMAGLSVILVSLFLDSKGSHCRWLKWLGALCLIISSLIRFASLQMLVLASAPLILVCVFHNFKVINLKPYLVPAVVAIIGISSCKFYDTHYYQQDEDWRNFMQYHAAAAQVSNNVLVPYTEETRKVFDDTGWSHADYLMIRDFNYLDPDTFSSANLKRFDKQKNATNLRKHPQVLQARVNAFKNLFTNSVSVISLIAAIFFASLNQKNCWQRSIVKWLLMWSALIMLGLIIYKKLPERVFIPLTALPFYLSLLLNLPDLSSQIKNQKFKKHFVFRTGVLLLFLAATASAWGQVKRSDLMVMGNIRFKNDLKNLQESWPDKVFLAQCRFPVDLFLPLDNQSEIQGMKWLYLTGRQKSPLFQQKMKEYGIHSAYTELYETDRLYLIMLPRFIPLFESYLKQHYDVDLEFKNVYSGRHFQVYRVSTSARDKNTNNEMEHSAIKE
ncbi:hypothetical protein FYZ48_04455 [Gimesia chilikensis]|uniref:hypothetical protein n=1 Tax=Gimesia chilikensis TaxID=2605989 RepID=UPI0011EBC250|nr:hypothetical protein [Gimesia chilikensis]KAA0140535.1 hypothetical protein FYZ48_04455 [Gimesia chilikensis]